MLFTIKNKIDSIGEVDAKIQSVIDGIIKRNPGDNVLGSLDTQATITSKWQTVLSKADSLNSKAIIDVLDALPRSVKDDPAAIANFKSFLSQLDLSKMAGFRVEVADTTDLSQGETDITNGIIQIAINNSDTSTLNPSPATVYMHEVLHAIFDYAFTTGRQNNPEVNALIEKLRQMHEDASKFIKPSDLCGKNATKAEKATASQIWNYVFNNPSGNDRGLKEFLSYALTDKAFISLLSKNKIAGTKVSFMTRIKQFITTLFNLITLQETVSDIINKKNAFNNNNLRQYAEQSYYSAVTQLVKDIQKANAEATTNMKGYNKFIYGFYNLVNTLREAGNEVLTPFTRSLFNFVKINPTAKPDVFDVVKMLAALPFSHNARVAWYQFISKVSTHLEYQDIRLLLDDFASIDKTREVLDRFARNNRVAEAYYQQVKNTVVSGLETAFGKELTSEEQQTLTQIVLNTDLQCLYNGKNYDDIERLIKDSIYRTQNIEALQKHPIDVQSSNSFAVALSDKTNKRIAKGLEEISNKWAYILYYGKGDNSIGTQDNINTIGDRISRIVVDSVLSDSNMPKDILVKQKIKEEVTEQIKERLNKLTTLKAIDITLQKTPNALVAFNGLSKKGIKTLLDEQKGFVDNVKSVESKLERMKEEGKGYTAVQYNQVIDYKIVPLTEKDKMEYNGYVLVDNIHNKQNMLFDTGTGLKMKNNVDCGIFIKKNTLMNKRSNSAFSFIASKWSSKDIFSYLEDSVSLEEAVSNSIVAKVEQEIQQGKLLDDMRNPMIERRTREAIENKYWTTVERARDNDIAKAFSLQHSKNAQQAEREVLSTAFDGDSYNPLTRQEKVEKLKLSQNAFDIISKQVATQTAFNKGRQENIALAALLQDFAKYNMNKVTHMDNNNGKKYINVTERLVKELHLSKDILAGGAYGKGEVVPDFWVREDFVERLFGVENVNLSLAKFKSGPRKGYSLYTPMMRGAFEILETILKVFGYKEKETIIMRKPRVLIGNVMSNISYNCLSEPNLKKVLEMNYANVQNTNNYIQAQKEYIELEHKAQIKQITNVEKAKMRRLKERMDNNPIAPLFESGMFTSIVEDVSLKDKEAVQDYLEGIENSTILSGASKGLRVFFNQLYMREGTPIFDAFYNINKYSDFVARATEYQIQMERHQKEIAQNPNREELIKKQVLGEVWNAFIDYDRPNGKVEQYLNDVGILMFTKYAKGVQRVIMKQFTNNPVGLLVQLAREMVLPFDVDSIYQSNVFSKKWGYMIHDPIDNIIDVILPPLPRLILGVL